MERWKMSMRFNRKDELKDIRICGDCKHSIPNPKDRPSTYIDKGILLCLETLTPVHRAKSVNFCNSYAIEDDQCQSERKRKKRSW